MSHVEQMMIERVAHELGAGGPAQLLLDMRAMGLDGPGREEELFRDLAVGMAEGDQSQHHELALAEIVGWPGWLVRCGGHAGAETGVEVGVAGGGQADGLEQLLIGGLLEYESERTRPESLARERG